MFSLRFPFSKVSLSAVLVLIFTGIAAVNFAQTNLPELKRGHQGWLETFALSPSNKYLATLGSDHQVILWDYVTGKQVREIKNLTGITDLAISPDDRYLFCADTASRIKKWDLTTGKLLFDIVAHKPLPDQKDAELLLEAMIDDDDIDAERRELIRKRYVRSQLTPKEYLPQNSFLELSADGLWLVSTGIDHKLKLWNAKTGQFVREIATLEENSREIVLTKDNKHLIITYLFEPAKVYAFDSGKIVASFNHDGAIHAHNLSKDQRYLYNLTSNYSTLQKIDLTNGQVISSLKLEVQLSYMASKLQDESTIVGVGRNDTIFNLDINTGKILQRVKGLTKAWQYTLDQKNQLVFADYQGKKVICHNLQLNKPIQKFGVYTPDIQSANFSEDGLHILVNDSEINLHKIDLNPAQAVLSTYPLIDEEVKHHIRLSPDSKTLIAANAEGTVFVWKMGGQAELDQDPHLSSKILVHQQRNTFPTITNVHFTPNGQAIVLADFLYGLHFLDPQKITDQFFQHEDMVEDFNLIQFSKDSNAILVNLIEDGFGEFYQLNVKDWTAQSIKDKKLSKKFTVTNVPDRLIHFDFTRDFKLLLYRNEFGEGGIQEVETGQKLLVLNNCRFLDWMGSTQQFVMLISLQKVVIWDVVNKKISSQYDLPYSPLHADLHPQGNLLLLVRPDQSLELRNVLDGKTLLNFFWQAGTNNFHLKNAEGKIDATSWKKLQEVLSLKTSPVVPLQNVATLPPASTQKTPDEVDAVILNLGHHAPIVHMSIHNNGQYLWTVDNAEGGKVWALPEGRELRSISHHILEQDNRYLRSNSLQKLSIHRRYSANIWEIDLNTGQINKTGQEPSKDYFFDAASLESYELQNSRVETLRFILPNKKTLVKNLNRPYFTQRYLLNSEKNIISVYGERYGRYVERTLLSFHGNDFQDSTEIYLGIHEFKDFWVWPGTDSLLGKTKDKKLYLFHPLKKGQTFKPLFQGTKINALTFSPDQQFFAMAHQESGAVEIRQVKGKTLSVQRYFPSKEINHLAFTPSGENLLISDGHRIWNWDLKKDSIYQFADFYAVNQSNMSFDSRVYIHLFSSGKIVFKIPTEDHMETYKIVDLYKRETSFQEVDRWSKLYKTNDRAIITGSTRGEYFDLFRQQHFNIPLWNGFINKLCTSRDRNRWGMIKDDGKEFVWWDYAQAKAIFSKSPKASFSGLALDQRDSLLALVDKNHVVLLNTNTGREKALIPIFVEMPERVIMKFSADARYLFINSPYDGRITIWDLRSNALLRTIVLPYGGVEIFDISEDNQYIYGLVDSWLVAYNIQGKELYRLDFKLRDIVAAYFPLDKKIIVASNHGIIFQVDPLAGNLLKTVYLGQMGKWISIDQNKQFETSSNAANYVHYRSKSGRIGYFSAQKTATSEVFPALLKLQKASPVPSILTTAPSSSFHLVNAMLKSQLKEPKLNPSKIYANKLPFESPIVNAFFSKDDRTMIIQESGGKIIFIEKATLRWLKTINLKKTSSVKSLLSQDGQYFICLEGNNTLHLYNISNGSLLQQKKLENAFVTTIALSPEGTLVVGTLEGFIHLLKMPDLSLYQSIRPADAKILSLAITPENEQLIVADVHSNLYLYDLAPPFKASAPKLLGNYGAYGPIHQLEVSHNHSLIVRAKEQIFSFQYTTGAKNFAIKTQADWMHIHPSNTDLLYYDASPTIMRGHRWMIFDLQTFTPVDSIQETSDIYALSHDGELGITGKAVSNGGAAIYHFSELKETSLSSAEISCTNWDISGNTMYYQSEESVHRVDLAASTSENIKGRFYYGKFLPEGNKYNYVGTFYSPREGVGKRVLGDTTYVWQPGKMQGSSAVSRNGKYLAYWPINQDSIFVYSSLDHQLVYKFSPDKHERGYLYLANNGKYLVIFIGATGFSAFDLSTKKQILSEPQSGVDLIFSQDGRNLILSSPKGSRVYDLASGKIVQTLAYNTPQKRLRVVSSNARFALIDRPNEALQLWDLSKGAYLGDFYFFALWSTTAWAFVSLDGRYEGSPEGLKRLYQLDEKTLSTKDLSLEPGAGYTPGLLIKLIK